MTGSAWRASLRIARRDALRSKARSLLVIVMVGLPVAATTGLVALLATIDVDTREALPSVLGTTQAQVIPNGHTPLDQDAIGQSYQPRTSEPGHQADGSFDSGAAPASDADTVPWTPVQVQRLTGGRLLTVRTGSTAREDGRRTRPTPVREIDLTDPATSGMVDLLSGRVPRRMGEVDVSPALQRSGIAVGDALSLARGTVTVRVVGVARARFASDDPQLQAFPGTVLRPDSSSVVYLVDRSAPVTWRDVRALNDVGLVVVSRDVVEHPPSPSQVPASVREHAGGSDAQVRAVLAIAIVAIVVEVVLLAGPAFAVGVSRQRRQLALVAATGGDPRDVRRVVLAQGVVLGLGAAVLGVGVGLVGARLASGPLHRISDVGPFDIVVWQVLAAFLLGAGAALVAAWMPARQASRLDVVAVLAGRRGTVRSTRGLPVVGALLVVVGAGGAVVVGSRSGGEVYAAAGTVVVVLGMVALMPAVLGLVGRTAKHLPLPLRLAARDASRQRGRTAPAVAAVMGAVAGITAIAIGSSSDFAQARRDYEPAYAMGTTVVSAYGLDDASWRDLVRAVPQVLHGRHLVPAGVVSARYDDQGRQVTPGPGDLAIGLSGCAAPHRGDVSGEHPTCEVTNGFAKPSTIASPATVEALGESLTTAQSAALVDGRVLVGDRRMLRSDGTVQLYLTATDDQGRLSQVRTLRAAPAVLVDPGPSRSAVVMTAATAGRLGLPVLRDAGVIASAGAPLTPADDERLKEIVPVDDPDHAVYTERGFQETYAVQLIVLALAGLLTVLVGTLTATGLALAEARPDLATLAAVGARPRTRRTMAAVQALLIGLLGALTGVLVGFVPGWAVSRPLTMNGPDSPAVFDVPWLLLGGIGIGVPLLAALGALAMTRSRLPMTRRLG